MNNADYIWGRGDLWRATLNPQAWDEISKDYLGNIVSPFARGTSNPLFDLLLSVLVRAERSVR